MSNQKSRIAVEIIGGALLITAAYFAVHSRDESIWPKHRTAVDSGSREVMGTFAHIVAVATDEGIGRKCVEKAFEQLELVDNLMSDYKTDSELSKVNRDAFRQTIKVSEHTFTVLKRSIEYSRLSGGAFDVTIGPLVDLWHQAGQKNVKPSEQEVAAAKAKVGYDKLILDEPNRTVRFAAEGMRLDLGAIAKGYAVDLAICAMQQTGAIGGMVDAGGDIRCFGAPPQGKERWLIGLQEPQADEKGNVSQKIILVLKLINEAVATSGDYQRFVLIGGKRYSHIINPSKGAGTVEFASVTVIAKNATQADALATAVSVMGKEKGLALVESIPDADAILITPGPEFNVVQTRGAKHYIEE